MARDTLSYCAGMFDADGCFTMYESASKGSAKYPYMSAAATVEIRDEKIVDMFVAQFGGAKLKKPARKATHSDTYVWRVSRAKLDTFIETIEPYLVLKVEQAQTIRDMRRVRAGKASKPITEDEYKALLTFKERMTTLNKTGVGK